MEEHMNGRVFYFRKEHKASGCSEFDKSVVVGFQDISNNNKKM